MSGIVSENIPLQSLQKQKINQKTTIIEYENKLTDEQYYAEYVFDRRYTRYTICGIKERNYQGVEDFDISSMDDISDMFDLGEALNDEFALDETSMQTSLEDVWNTVSEEDTSTIVSDEVDPNDTLSASEDVEKEVEVVYDSGVEQSDNITVLKQEVYDQDFMVEDLGYLLHDEITTAPEPLVLHKYTLRHENEILNLDEKIYPLVTFSASKGVRSAKQESVMAPMGILVVEVFRNLNGEVLKEIRLGTTQDVISQSYMSADGNVTITQYFKVIGNTLADKLKFRQKLFPVKYSEHRLEVQTKSQITKNKDFKIHTDRRCLHLPNINYFRSKLNVEYVTESNYKIVDDIGELRDITDMLLSTPDKVIGYDAETQGLRFHRWINNKHLLVTHSLSWENHQSIIIPVRMKYRKNIDPEVAADVLRPLLENNPILAHNGAADTRFLIDEGINLNLQEDTMHLIKHLIPFINHKEVVGFGKAIDDLIIRAFGVDMIDLHKYVFKPNNVPFDFSLLNDDYMIWYGCPDTDLMRMLWKGLRPKLHPDQLLAYKNTVKFSKEVAINSTYGGIGVNELHIKKEKEHAQNVVDKLEDVMYRLTGESRQTLSLTSSVQKTNYIFGKMGAPVTMARRTSKGLLSADKTVVQNLAALKSEVPTDIFKEDIYDEDGNILITAQELNEKQFPFCTLLRKHGDLVKNITAFYNGMLNNSIEGVYYPDFRIGATDTWRTTDRIQITKKQIKKDLGIYNDDWNWCSTDYAAEEFRLAANGSEDWNLIEMLKDKEADPHTMVASELHGIPPYEVSGELRSQTKAANFGIIYGMKYRALATSIYRVDEPTEEQLAVSANLYALYTYKRAVMLKPLEKAKDDVRDHAWTKNHLGYRMCYAEIIDVKDYVRQVFDLTDKTPPIPKIDPEQKRMRLGKLLNACGNFPIQSWAAGILMEVYPKFVESCRENKVQQDVVVPLQVHDEIGICFKKNTVNPYLLIKLQNETMVSDLPYLHKDVAPLYIGVGFGSSWGEGKSDDLEIPTALQEIMIDEYNSGKAPSIEEINAEGCKEHFSRRIREYMVSRVRELFKDMITEKHFNRQKMQFILNKNMFVGKKVSELFHTNDVKTKEIIIEKYLELIYGKSLDEIKSDGVTWEEGEKILDETEKEVNTSGIVDFFFLPEIHPRLTVGNETVMVNLTNVYTSIVNNVIKYFDIICNDEENIHNKELHIKTDSGLKVMPKKILGLPTNFSEVFNKILAGNDITITRNESGKIPTVDIDEVPIQYRKDEMIIDINALNRISPNLFNDISKILTKYISKSVIAEIKIMVQGDNLVDSGLRMVYYNINMQQQISSIVASYKAKLEQAAN